MNTRLISAICTPLTDDDSLHVVGLAAHLEDQWTHGIQGVLVAGSMGMMQLLDDATYRDLVRHAAQLGRGRGEILIGVGDASFKRTLDRIRYVEQFDVDGVVALAPYFFQLGQAELIAYYTGLADQSKKPLYLYDLPQRTRTTMNLETVLELAKHPNIHGIKCSGEWTGTRRLMAHLNHGFRIVPAQPTLVDMLIHDGVRENLDGIFSILPGLAVSIAEAAEAGDWQRAATRQNELTEFLHVIAVEYPLFPACTAILNARGIPGKVHQLPTKSLEPEQREKLFANSLVRKLLDESPSPSK